MSEIIDADAHVVEGASFAKEALSRWPELVKYRVAEDGTGGFFIEGRRYPEHEGPGAGCPPQHGLSRAEGIDPFSLEGMLRDADRDQIDRMVLFPSMGLAVPSFRDLGFAGITTDAKVAKISIVGAGIQNAPGYAARMFGALADAGVNILMISTSEIRITCIIGEADLDAAAEAIHRTFRLEASQPAPEGAAAAT